MTTATSAAKLPVERHQGRLNNVDSLRFLAMVGVIAQHCNIFPLGWVGVWWFFTISGFVVTESLARGDHSNRLAALKTFYLRRIFRICPLYYIFCVIVVAFFIAQGSPLAGAQIASLVLFYFNYFSIFHDQWTPQLPFTHLWSISSEMQFYAVFGFAYILLSRPALKNFLFFSIFAVFVTRIIFANYQYSNPAAGYDYQLSINHSFISSVDAFSVGILLSIFGKRIAGRHALGILLTGFAATVIFFAAYAGINAFYLGRHGLEIVKDIASGENVGQYREVMIYTPILLLSAGLVACASRDTMICRLLLLNLPLMQRAGKTSYSGYIWHFLVIVVMQELLEPVAARFFNGSALALGMMVFFCAVPLTVAIAELSFRFIEVPLNLFSRPNQPSKPVKVSSPARVC